MTNSAVQHSIARYNEKRDVEKTSIHAFRHTFAKHYIKSGGNAFKLQKLLGHSSLTVTQDYISLFGEDLAEDFGKHSIIHKYSGREKLKSKVIIMK